MIFRGSNNSWISVWDLKKANWANPKILEGHSGWICSVTFSPDGKYLASLDQNGNLKIWSTNVNS